MWPGRPSVVVKGRLSLPTAHSTVHGLDGKAGSAEGLGGLARAPAAAAHGRDGAARVELAHAAGQLTEGDVHGAGDPASGPLVALSDVEDLDVVALGLNSSGVHCVPP